MISTFVFSRRYLAQAERRELIDSVRKQIRSGDSESVISTLEASASPDGMLDPEAQSLFDRIRRLMGNDYDGEFMDALSERDIESEFTWVRQARDLSADGQATMRIRNGDTEFGISIDTDNRCRWLGDIRDYFPSVIYYDTPFILDDDQPGFYSLLQSNHRESLNAKLTPREKRILETMESRRDAARFYELMRTVIDGDFMMDRNGLKYVSKNGLGLNMSNMAAGAKVFGILRILADNGYLKEGALLLLDEPESHLHPEWLDLLAKMIVLLAKDLRVRVVMTTHSPLLLLAVQTYSLEYGQHADYYSIARDGEGPSAVDDLHGDLTGVYDAMTRSFLETNQLYRRLTGDRDDSRSVLEPRRRAPPGHRIFAVRFHPRPPEQCRRREDGLPRRHGQSESQRERPAEDRRCRVHHEQGRDLRRIQGVRGSPERGGGEDRSAGGPDVGG